MGRIRMERARLLFRGQPSRKFTVLLSRSSHHREQHTGRRVAFSYLQIGFFFFVDSLDIEVCFAVGLHKRRYVKVSSEEIAALAGARSQLLRARRRTSDMSGASASLAPATGAANAGGLFALEIFDRQLDLSRERFALYESIRPTLRSTASPTDADREFQQLLE